MESIKQIKDMKEKSFIEGDLNNEDNVYDGISAVSIAHAYMKVIEKKPFLTERDMKLRSFILKNYLWKSLYMSLRQMKRDKFQNDTLWKEAVKQREYFYKQVFQKKIMQLCQIDSKILREFDSCLYVFEVDREEKKKKVVENVNNFVLGRVIKR